MEAHPRYQLLDKIASGSFATVYRGRDLELGREVAIKQIHDQYLSDPQQLDRYWGEAQLLASFQHPNIVTIYDIVRERGWLILELMQSDLSKIAGRKQMPLESLRTTLAHSLRALKFLHAHGIVHGDIKPSNMMIDRRRRVKIGDFGLARRVSNEQGSLIKGTTKYMAPEVVSDEFGDVGPASDLYSLGFAAYELMCGDKFEELFPGLNAFGRDRQMAWMMWHAAPDRRLPEISRVLAEVPEDLARTIQKLTAKPQSQRYKYADEALSDLNIDLKLVKSGEESTDHLGRTTIIKSAPGKRRILAIAAFAASLILSAFALWPSGSGDSQPVVKNDNVTRGIVRSVESNEDKIVIEDEQGAPDEIAIGKKPKIRLFSMEDDRFVLLRELAPQDRVEIRFEESGGKRTAVVTAMRPVQGTGKIRDVDAASRKLVVTLAADPHPQDVPMYVPAGARLLLNGMTAKIDELGPGDRVTVVHLKDTEGRAARDVIKLDALRMMQVTAFISGITVRNDHPWLAIERLRAPSDAPGESRRERKEIQFADDCRITINGKPDDGGRKYVPADLKRGDRVEVSYDAQVTGVDAVRRLSLIGTTLRRVNQTAREMVVQPDNASEATFTVPEDCQITRDEQKADFSELQEGDTLDISYEQPADMPGVAYTIDARRLK